jgi:hypothetical protein
MAEKVDCFGAMIFGVGWNCSFAHHPPATMKPKPVKGSKQNYSSQTQERE